MTRESVNETINETITIINNNMTALGDTPTAPQVEDVIREAVTHAYNETAVEDRIYLYRQLALKFSTDKLPQSGNYFAIVVRQRSDLINIPMQVLGQVNVSQDLLGAFAANPQQATQSILEQFFLRFADELGQYNRYMAPIASMVYMTQAIINTAIIVAVIADLMALLVINFSLSSIRALNQNWVNLTTGNQFKRELDRLVTTKCLAERAEEFLWGMQVDTSAVQDDEEMLVFFRSRMEADGVDNEAADKLLNDLAKAHNNAGLRYLNAMKDAVLHNITSDLPLDAVRKVQAILYRILLAVLLIPFLAIDASAQLMMNAVAIAPLGLLATALFVKVAATLLLNSPLYAWDGLTYLVNALVSTLSQMMDAMKAYFTADASPDVDAAAASNPPHSLSTRFGMFAPPPARDPVAGNDEQYHKETTPGYGSSDID
ncbi:MAG TPA: hypothetical protein DDY37_02305 [Legionella sp.]|nr:hypothetical protein [Legionella sp.]